MRVAIGGFGAIGQEVARALVDGIQGLELAAVSGRDTAKAARHLEALGAHADVLPLAALAGVADIVVECAPAAVFRELALPVIEAGKIFVPLSVGQLLVHDDLETLAAETGARILVPTGALLGLDAVRAAAEGTIESVTMVTRKPPGGLKGAPHLVQNNIEVDGLSEALCVFKGTAREGAKGFPANVNVAAALSLAGIGPDRTTLEIWADPAVTRNMHEIRVEADSARFTLGIENVPSEANPRTGKITALSTIALLRGLTQTMRVGS